MTGFWTAALLGFAAGVVGVIALFALVGVRRERLLRENRALWLVVDGLQQQRDGALEIAGAYERAISQGGRCDVLELNTALESGRARSEAGAAKCREQLERLRGRR